MSTVFFDGDSQAGRPLLMLVSRRRAGVRFDMSSRDDQADVAGQAVSHVVELEVLVVPDGKRIRNPSENRL